ncbi:hypothetical protein HDE77_002496 [Rhodanobacter sp. MP7CTX1]|nr:hypothetical protein [Rhodanobacter sp. MP7CTX1]
MQPTKARFDVESPQDWPLTPSLSPQGKRGQLRTPATAPTTPNALRKP